MKKTMRLISILLAVLLVPSLLAGCESKTNDENKSSTESREIVNEAVEPGSTEGNESSSESPAGTVAPETSSQNKKPEESKTPEETEKTVQSETSETSAPAHEHTWVAQTKTVHHDAEYTTKWVVDSAAYDEKVKVKDAYDEKVKVKDAYDEKVLVKDAWDEKVKIKDAWDEDVTETKTVAHTVCGDCGIYLENLSQEKIDEHCANHMLNGGNGDYYSDHVEETVTKTVHHDAEYETVHHDAEYKTVHHDAEYETVHHDAEYKTVHHDEVGHYEKVKTKDAWDETVTTGYKCSGCGAEK